MRATLLLMMLAGCSSQGVPRCDVDPDALGAPTEGAVLIRDENGALHDAVEGAAVPLVSQPGGGRYLFLSARVRHLRAGKGRARALLYAGNVRSVEEREVDLFTDDECWLRPRMPALANLNSLLACPPLYDVRVVGQEWTVLVTVSDDEGQAAEARARVVPTCVESDPVERARCECECGTDFSFGKCR